mgnify:CR=1 FL=1
MKLYIASDHAGFELKAYLKTNIKNIEWIDLGCDNNNPVDYPDYAADLARHVVNDHLKGVMICGSGIGANIAANKIRGARASLCHDLYSAQQGVEHDDMNILVLGGRVIDKDLALQIVKIFMTAQFSQEERHVRRLNKILALEKK